MTLSPPTSRTINGRLDYIEDTSAFSVTAASEATATTLVTTAARVYDGATLVCIRFECPAVSIPPNAAGNFVSFNLWDAAVDLGRIATAQWPTNAGTLALPAVGDRFITPSAGSHTYAIKAWRTNANCTADGSTPRLPTFISVTRVAVL